MMKPVERIPETIIKNPNYVADPLGFELSNTNTNVEHFEINAPNTSILVSQNPNFVQCKPDPDCIKMFVGQIPHTFNEYDLLQMFEKYGKVYDLRVLKDKTSGKSKGCCFVTFFTKKAALVAQNALHNIKILPGMHHPVQMKPADSENRNDRKLFVGMLSKMYTENDIRNLFSPYGTIEECTVLRDSTGKSKGCAFVTYLSRQSAQNAVKSMHNCHTFDGCSSPMVVKFADTQKDKEIRKMQLIPNDMFDQGNISNFLRQISVEALSSFVASNSLLHQLQTNGYINTNSTSSFLNHLNLAQLETLNLGPLLSSGPQIKNYINNPLLNEKSAQQFNPLPVNDTSVLNSLTQINNSNNHGLLSLGYNENIFNPRVSPPIETTDRQDSFEKYDLNQKQIEGPNGANLFIYHLPQEFTDRKLAELFKPFGKVVSAKVFIDKITKQSKCFGFVSYDNVDSAKSAIQNLNGYHILGKKLKVEEKRKKQPVTEVH